jgi:hypothetical protein
MWIFPVLALTLIGYGFYIMSDTSDAGLVLVFFASVLFVVAIIAILPNRDRKEAISEGKKQNKC